MHNACLIPHGILSEEDASLVVDKNKMHRAMEHHIERNDTNEHNSRESLVAVVADGTGSNTGWKDGMLAHVERFI